MSDLPSAPSRPGEDRYSLSGPRTLDEYQRMMSQVPDVRSRRGVDGMRRRLARAVSRAAGKTGMPKVPSSARSDPARGVWMTPRGRRSGW
jgi:hypothetical protein